MKILSLALGVGFVINLVSCGQSFSDKEKELMTDSVNEVIAANDKEKPKVVENTATYDLPFCDLLPTSDIKKVFPEASNFEVKESKERRPECEITFASGEMIPGMKNPGGVIIGGFIPRKRETVRTFLERTLAGNENNKKIEGLGDEAYIFPDEASSFVVIIKDGLSYSLRLNRINDNNEENILKLAKILVENI